MAIKDWVKLQKHWLNPAASTPKELLASQQASWTLEAGQVENGQSMF